MRSDAREARRIATELERRGWTVRYNRHIVVTAPDGQVVTFPGTPGRRLHLVYRSLRRLGVDLEDRG